MNAQTMEPIKNDNAIFVKVTYTVKSDFVKQNQKNIQNFLDDFDNLSQEGFNYKIFLSDDGKTFIHLSEYRNKKIQQRLLNIPSFLQFQKKRDESGLLESPKIDVMKMVGSSKRIFND